MVKTHNTDKANGEVLIAETKQLREEPGAEGEFPFGQRDMVGWMKELRDARAELHDTEERGREYLRQCKEEVEEDLAPQRARVKKLEEMIELYIRHENGGEKYRVPGVGTAFLTKRQKATITDPERFMAFMREQNPLKLQTIVDEKLNETKARQYVMEMLEESGEVLQGADVEEKESLSFRS